MTVEKIRYQPGHCSQCGQAYIFDPEDEMFVCPDALMEPTVECKGAKTSD